MSVDARWQMVKCSGCGKEYRCTPSQDYFNNTTLEDGVCWDCLLAPTNMEGQPEPGYPDAPGE